MKLHGTLELSTHLPIYLRTYEHAYLLTYCLPTCQHYYVSLSPFVLLTPSIRLSVSQSVSP